MPDTPPPTGPPPDTSGAAIEQNILKSLQLIEEHTRAMTSLIPDASVKIGEQIAQFKYNVGPSTPDKSTPAGIGPSSGASVGSDPLGGPMSWLHYPGTKPTPVDYFQMFGNAATQMAQKSVNKRLTAQLPTLMDSGEVPQGTQVNKLGTLVDAQGQPVPLGDISDNAATVLQGISQQGGKAGSLASLSGSLASGYVTGRKIQGLLSDVTAPLAGLSTLGYQTGQQGGSQGILGIRSPFDTGLIGGIGQRISQLGFSFTNDVTPGQAANTYQQLYGLGWLAGPQTNAMRAAGADLTNFNSALGQNPQTYALMDQATRLGTASLSQFVTTMKQVPDSMNAAHVSMQQTLGDMEQVVQITKQQGGLPIQGMQLANAWQQITGLPASSMIPLMNNPIVQGQTFLQTGLMPWEQGLATPGSRINSIMGAIGMMKNIIQPRAAITQKLGMGFTATEGSNEQQFALMSHFFGVDSATLMNLYSHRQGITAGSNMLNYTDAWTKEMMNSKNPSQYLKSNTASNNWGAIRKSLHEAMSLGNDGKAHYMFTPKQIQAIADVQRNVVDSQLGSGWQSGHWAPGVGAGRPIRGTAKEQHQAGEHWVRGFQQNQSVSNASLQAMESGKAALPTAVAREVGQKRSQMIKHIIAQHTQNQQGNGQNNITISLNKAAAKYFKLADPGAQNKAATNAGSVSINPNPGVTGPTSSPLPDMNTAGNDVNMPPPGESYSNYTNYGTNNQ